MSQPQHSNDRLRSTQGNQHPNLLVVPALVDAGTALPSRTRNLIPREHLEAGDAIEVMSKHVAPPSSWNSPAASVVTLISTAGGARLNVTTSQGDVRAVTLGACEAVTLWPGSAYQIVSAGDGDVIRLQRDVKAVHAHRPTAPPPSSGYSLHTPSRANTEEGLVDILPATAVPGFEVKLVEGFTENKPHYHQTFDEAYYNIAGALTVKLTPHSTGVSQTLDVPVGGCALIPRYTDHHVLGGSNDNKILVFYWPRFNGKPGNDWHPA